MQNILVNQMQISRPGISIRYLKFLIGRTANIGDIPESAVVILVSRTSDTTLRAFAQVSDSIPLLSTRDKIDSCSSAQGARPRAPGRLYSAP